jgi:hypothetical protein
MLAGEVNTLSKQVNDFLTYQNVVNLEFDLRITALEP